MSSAAGNCSVNFFAQLNNAPCPSLQEMCSIAICKRLWECVHANRMGRGIPSPLDLSVEVDNSIRLLFVTNKPKVKEAMHQLVVPPSIMDSLDEKLTTLSDELHRVACKMCEYFGVFDFSVLPLNVYGVVDKLKMAEQFINAECSDERKFWIACAFCMEDQAQSIWSKLPTNMKNRYLQGNVWRYVNVDFADLLLYWSRKVYGMVVVFSNEAIINLIYTRNEIALKYFWKTMANDEKRSVALGLFGLSDSMFIFYVSTHWDVGIALILLREVLNHPEYDNELVKAKRASLLWGTLLCYTSYQQAPPFRQTDELFVVFESVLRMCFATDRAAVVDFKNRMVRDIETKRHIPDEKRQVKVFEIIDKIIGESSV